MVAFSPAQVAFQSALRVCWAESRVRNSSYSLRAFSKKIGLSPSALSEIFRGQRRVSRKLATRVLQKIQIPDSDREHILSLFTRDHDMAPARAAEQEKTDHTAQDLFVFLSDRQHQLIWSILKAHAPLNLTELTALLPQHLRRIVTGCLERLTRIDQIHTDSTTGKIHLSSDGSASIQALQLPLQAIAEQNLIRQSLEASLLALQSVGGTTTTATLPVTHIRFGNLSANGVAKINTALAAFKAQISTICEEDLKTQITENKHPVQILFQLCPSFTESYEDQSAGNSAK